jgi:predicted DNA-binding transcriptional regulator AlpA
VANHMHTQTAEAAEYLTLPEVAQHYRTTEATVRYWRHTGHGPKGVKLGTRVLYPRAEIERFDAQLAQDAGAGHASPARQLA